MAVASKKLASGGLTRGAERIVYTCPPGHTTIVKDIRIFGGLEAINRLVVFLASGPSRVALIDEPLAIGKGTHAAPWAVLAPGDQVGVYIENASVTYWVSGSELIGTAG